MHNLTFLNISGRKYITCILLYYIIQSRSSSTCYLWLYWEDKLRSNEASGCWLWNNIKIASRDAEQSQQSRRHEKINLNLAGVWGETGNELTDLTYYDIIWINGDHIIQIYWERDFYYHLYQYHQKKDFNPAAKVIIIRSVLFSRINNHTFVFHQILWCW